MRRSSAIRTACSSPSASGGSWRKLTYAEARQIVDALAQGLLARGLSAERPVMILSGNSIDHALLTLAGHTAGIPVAPISVAYSLQSQDHAKLKHIAELLAPGLIYVADTGPFAKALAALDLTQAEIVASRNGAEPRRRHAFDDMAQSRPGPAVDQAAAAIGADTIAKILFTSGSTGLPKGVINTHGMLTANQQQLAQIWPFLDEAPLVLLDWLPWNHTFGGNHNFNLVLRHAGTLFIDGGRPVPGADRRDRAQPRRDIAHDLFQRAGRLRGAAAVSRTRRGAGALVFRQAAADLLCRRRAAAGPVGRGSKRCRCARPASACR